MSEQEAKPGGERRGLETGAQESDGSFQGDGFADRRLIHREVRSQHSSLVAAEFTDKEGLHGEVSMLAMKKIETYKDEFATRLLRTAVHIRNDDHTLTASDVERAHHVVRASHHARSITFELILARGSQVVGPIIGTAVIASMPTQPWAWVGGSIVGALIWVLGACLEASRS